MRRKRIQLRRRNPNTTEIAKKVRIIKMNLKKRSRKKQIGCRKRRGKVEEMPENNNNSNNQVASKSLRKNRIIVNKKRNRFRKGNGDKEDKERKGKAMSKNIEKIG